MTIARIVAAIDFSAASAQALRRAVRLAGEQGAELQVVTVLPAGWLAQIRSWLADAQVAPDAAAVQQRLDQWLAPSRGDGLRAATRVLEGDARDEIAAYADRAGAQLVVVGAHGRSLLGEAVLGSTALALLERCDVPILVVRNEAARDYRRLLVGIALAEASEQAPRFAADLCPQAQLTLLHAYEDPFAAELFLGQADPQTESHYRARARAQAQAGLDAFVARLGPLGDRCHALLAYGAPGLQLAHTAERQGAELVVLGARRKRPLETALLGSVASNAALMVTADVLLVREAASSGADSTR